MTNSAGTQPARRSQIDDQETITLDSVGAPALSSAVPAVMRLLRSQINSLRENRPRLTVHTERPDVMHNVEQQGQPNN